MNPEDKIVWEAWGAFQQYAEADESCPQRLRAMVKEYQLRLKAAGYKPALLRDVVEIVRPAQVPESACDSFVNKPRGMA